MTLKLAAALLCVAVGLAAGSAWAQHKRPAGSTHRSGNAAHRPAATPQQPAATKQAMLEPPANHYFVSKGSWGQNYPDQWALQRIGFDASPDSAWRLVRRDAKPVIVAVVDTGLDWNHRNIARENLWRNPKEIQNNTEDDDKDGFTDDIIGWDFFDKDNKPWDFDGHGTFVAGIIAGSWKDKDGMAGVNPFARLMVLKAINNFGHTRASFIARAIKYATDHGARVINLSVGGKERAPVTQAAIDYAYSKGVVLVVAAGNEGANVDSYGIAGQDKVLTVAATGFDDQRAVFSNWGKISVAAPGLDVLSLRAQRTDTMQGIAGVKYSVGAAYVGADKRYYRASGTSFSAPLVAGLASLMIADDPSLTNRQVMNIIKSTARDIGIPGVDQYTGYGIVDARAALKAPKDYFLFAGISRVQVVQGRQGQAVRVFGEADANAFKSARIEVGAGEKPTSWKPIGPAKKATGPDAVLGDVPAAAFAGHPLWQIRVIVTHRDGATREAHFRLNLG
jgi:subtilisin family serine protease